MSREKPLIEFTTDSKVIINGIEITSKNEWDRVLKHLEEYYKNFNKISSLLNYEQDKRIKLENIIKEIKSQLDYLETYSSKEDVFEDMKRRLDRIEKIIKENK